MRLRVLLVDAGLPTRCWELLKKDGTRRWRWSYPQFYVSGRQVNARRHCFERAHGPIPAGRQVFTRCGNHHCVNPEHLFLRELGSHRAIYRDLLPTPEAA